MTSSRTIRGCTAADHAAVDRVVGDAFGEAGAQIVALVADLRARDLVRAELVAEVDGEVVGHVLLSHTWLDTRSALLDVLLLSPLAVAPAYQSRGHGGALLAAASDAGEALGAPAILLEGDPGFYGRHGYEPAAAHGILRPHPRIPEPAFQIHRLSGSSHEPEALAGQLVYRDIWWEHDLGLRDPELAEIESRLV